MVYLLDVNVLIVLVDPAHVGHDQAHHWFAAWPQRPFWVANRRLN